MFSRILQKSKHGKDHSQHRCKIPSFASRRGRGRFDFKPETPETHGPVVPDVYHEYKGFGGDAIPLPKDFDVESIPENVRGFLNEIYRLLAQFSAWKLRDMTHGTAPYLKAEARKGEISTESMFDYFSTWLKK